MNIEEEIFKKSHVDFNKLKTYGFKKDKDNYIYSVSFLNNTFKAYITIDKSGNVIGKVYDIELDEEYTNIRIKTTENSFINTVKESYKEVLNDIKNNCFITDYFISNQANRIAKYIINKYNDKPEFMWEKYPEFAIFRNKNNNKWYSIIMNIDKSKITKGTGKVDIINIKSNEVLELIYKNGYYKAYHMNKKNWLTIILDDTLTDEEIIKQIDNSYNIVN